MSSPMIASCRPTCPMVLEEWEPGINLDCTPASSQGLTWTVLQLLRPPTPTCTGWGDAFLLYPSLLCGSPPPPQVPYHIPALLSPAPFSSLLSAGHSPDLLCEPSAKGVFPGRELFHFQFAPLHSQPPPQAASVSLLGKCSSSHPWGRCSPTLGQAPSPPPLLEDLRAPSPPTSCLSGLGPFLKVPQGRGSQEGGEGRASPPPALGASADCLAHPHPCCSFRNRMPFPLPCPQTKVAPRGQPGRRMLTAQPTPTTPSPGAHCWEVGGVSEQPPGPEACAILPSSNGLTSW
ncbi:unnamed protein product [Nyctereutes procyonoides]|uniref:(raccoon dog) hypothetical protein n=1 Tax=Nyctereutes procyonoides TaxID=34880 RepID=A0A811YLX1_NYCPR|nr:unnamed protein product [Nyctereutes procyonoides]